MSHNFVGGDCFDERDLIVSLEVTDLFLNTPNHLEIVDAELQLRVNIDLVADLPESFAHQNHVASLQRRF